MADVTSIRPGVRIINPQAEMIARLHLRQIEGHVHYMIAEVGRDRAMELLAGLTFGAPSPPRPAV